MRCKEPCTSANKRIQQNTYRASWRACCIADSIKLPEAECSLGMGTAIKIPLFCSSLMFASTVKVRE